MDEIMIAAKEVIGSSKVMSSTIQMNNPEIFDQRLARFRETMSSFIIMVVSAVTRYSLYEAFSWILEESDGLIDQSELTRKRNPTSAELSSKIMDAASSFAVTVSDAFYSGATNSETVRITEVNLAEFLKKIIVTCYENIPKEEEKKKVPEVKMPVALTNSLPVLPDLSPRGNQSPKFF